jgi:nitrous oxidase accessory protein
MINLLMKMAFAAELVVGFDAENVQATIDLAQPGDTVVLPPGRWQGPVLISKPITFESRGGTLVGSSGTTLRIASPNVLISGLLLEGSGSDLRGPDACIFVEKKAKGTRIENSQLSLCLFGIWMQGVSDSSVVGNRIGGLPNTRPASKGNGIHLHDCTRVEVDGNTVTEARDGIYVAATEDSVIVGNMVSDQRFGIHYMYSHGNEICGNVANRNSGGLALMESRDLVVNNNQAVGNERHGILFRGTTDSLIDGNIVSENAEGLFFFSSVQNVVTNNVIKDNNIGVRVWAGTVSNDIEGNSFLNNRQQVFYVASLDQTWGSNYWSDYIGWDHDSDGHGDRVYRNEAFTAQLLYRYPQAVHLLSSPTLEILSHLQSMIPALRIPSVVDPSPLVSIPQGNNNEYLNQ